MMYNQSIRTFGLHSSVVKPNLRYGFTTLKTVAFVLSDLSTKKTLTLLNDTDATLFKTLNAVGNFFLQKQMNTCIFTVVEQLRHETIVRGWIEKNPFSTLKGSNASMDARNLEEPRDETLTAMAKRSLKHQAINRTLE